MGTRQHDTDHRAFLVPASRLGIVAAPPLPAFVCAPALPFPPATVQFTGQGSLFLPS
jgi:hypothetical protein